MPANTSNPPPAPAMRTLRLSSSRLKKGSVVSMAADFDTLPRVTADARCDRRDGDALVEEWIGECIASAPDGGGDNEDLRGNRIGVDACVVLAASSRLGGGLGGHRDGAEPARAALARAARRGRGSGRLRGRAPHSIDRARRGGRAGQQD